MMKHPHNLSCRPARGFSLVEVLLAIFILGIGLIMVATIFPVGAKWTRENAEESLAANIARNAEAVIRAKYANGIPVASDGTLNGIPGFYNTVPLPERAYLFGQPNPYPAYSTWSKDATYRPGDRVTDGSNFFRARTSNKNVTPTEGAEWRQLADDPAATSLYYWTALVRRSPGAQNRYNLYILVFKKGDAENVFPTPDANELADTRNIGTEDRVPKLVKTAHGADINNPTPPVGAIGIGATSGTVFRQGTNANADAIVTRPAIASGEQVIWAPPADGTAASPLVYVYQTVLTY